MLQFGGHQFGCNVLIAGMHGVLTAALTGAQTCGLLAELGGDDVGVSILLPVNQV
jgi:hypothetical protein